jgi:hypothetical protein
MRDLTGQSRESGLFLVQEKAGGDLFSHVDVICLQVLGTCER